LRAQALLSWEKEKRLLASWEVRDGMHVLEVGSGPGFYTERLLTFLPTSHITCVDNNPTFLAHAQQKVQLIESQRVHFVEASILETGLPENTFDVAIARFVFQHLPDPLAAAKAIRSLLKPGGKLILIDSDDALYGIIQPSVPELTTVLAQYGEAQARRGGNRQIARQFWRLLAQAGFLPRAFEAVALHSDELGIEAFLEYFDPQRLLPLVHAGLLSEETFAQAYASSERFLASPHRLIIMLWFMAYGEKPFL
jgi:ubiquinone/menaquinone biosynthesis C-methylase UbiE